jgi:hypothetical protein
VSEGALLGLVGLALAILIAGLFLVVAVLDSAELALRRLVAGVWSARRAVGAAADLAAAVERDADRGRAELDRLRTLRHPRSGPDGNGGAGPVSLPFRPGPSSS